MENYIQNKILVKSLIITMLINSFKRIHLLKSDIENLQTEYLNFTDDDRVRFLKL